MIAAARAIFSKAFAIGLLAAVSLGLVTLVLKPIAAQRADLEDGLETQRTLLGRLRAEQSAAEAKTVLGGTPAAMPKGPVFLGGESDAIRLAGLQSRLSDAAQTAGTRLASTQVLPPREDAGVRLIGVQTQLSTTLEQLQKLVFELETARPVLIVQALHVSRGPDREGQEVTELDVRLTVLGATPRVKDPP
jgi:general secretion pathway protein M